MKILLIDGFSILNRAFYALPLLSNSEGEYTNAVFGFLNIFLKFLDEEKPDFVTVAFDLPQPTFRHEMYGAYKGKRKGMPDELCTQVPTLKVLLEKMGVVLASCVGYEADDVIGTLAVKAVAKGFRPVIVTGDRDLLQLASEEIKIRLPKTKAGKTEVEDYNAVQVLERYGVSPSAFVDVKALMGDTSDNIPGVPGIGEVTATKIIKAYGSLANAIAHVEEIKPKKAAENLAAFREQAILSRALAAIAIDAPVELELPEHGQVENFWNDEACEEISRLELKSIYRRIGGEMQMRQTDSWDGGSLGGVANDGNVSVSMSRLSVGIAPLREVAFERVRTMVEAREFFATLTQQNIGGAVFTLWDEDGAGTLFIVGVAIATGSYAVKYFHVGGELTIDRSCGDISEAELISVAKVWLECDSPKWVFDAKTEMRRFHRLGIKPRSITFDAMLAAYVLDATRPTASPCEIAEIYLKESAMSIEEILDNKGKRDKDRRTVASLDESTAADFAARSADIISRARSVMDEKLVANSQEKLFREIELPLAVELAEMEAVGIKVCRDTLVEFGEAMEKRLTALTVLIYDLADEEFNINSPQQLGEILFTKLGLKGGKKTTRGYSTAADVLEKLKSKHEIVPLILEYRAYAKLKSTYVEGMLPLIRNESSRIHSTFHQALTATGRLSSSEPNLQNIPVRTQLGRELRKAFVPESGCVFLDADYSQIELRLLAHMSGDATLIEAFRENQDIHRLTASQVLGILPEEVTSEQRDSAKAVNFGIVYGISAFGLSEDLKIPVKEAEKYIRGYFEKYPGVKRYLDETISRGKRDGFVSTLYNRRRALPELKSPNFNTRAFGERVAMNMPIQGTAADIIKLAMLNVSARLKQEELRTRIVLQVHDELLLEAPQEESDHVMHILKEEMERAADLQVPLAAEVNVGESWYATK